MLAALTASLPAQAATVTKSSPDNAGYVTIEYAAAAGEANSLQVDVNYTPTSGFQITFRDTGAIITPGPGCAASSPNEASCTVVSFEPIIEISTHDLGDSVTVLSSSSSTELFITEISGGDGNDILVGGPGNDTFLAGPGSDVMSGGAEFDTMSYRDRSEPVFVSPDGIANDGAAGEGDLVGAGIEIVWGGSGDDTLIGGPNRDLLDGNQGNDTLQGGAGADDLTGWAGHDVLIAGPGRDSVSGGGGNDRVFGGPGNDRMDTWRGNDTLQGGAGSDVLQGGPGRDRANGGADGDLFYMKDGYEDRVIGGPGRDRARLDRRLDRRSGIERLL